MAGPDTDDGATASVGALYAVDEAILALGISLGPVEPGTVELSFTPPRSMGNGHGIVHGGYLFLLADTAFAYAMASRGRAGVTVNAAIDFLAPAHIDVALTARATEFHRDASNGIYDVLIADAAGRTVATFRGHGRILRAS